MPFLQEKSNLSGEFITPSRGIKVHLKKNIFQCNLTLFQHRDEVLLMAIGSPFISIGFWNYHLWKVVEVCGVFLH